MTDAQWDLLEPLIYVAGKRGRRISADVRRVVDGMLYVSYTGCQWRCPPREFGTWTRVWSQFRRWSRNGTWSRLLAALHRHVRRRAGRPNPLPSMVVVDAHLGRGASLGGKTFHDRGGPYGSTNGAKRAIAVDITGMPLAALALPASTHENHTTAALLDGMSGRDQQDRLQLVLVDRGVTTAGAKKLSDARSLEVRRVGHEEKTGTFVPSPLAWRVEVAHGRLLRHRRLALLREHPGIRQRLAADRLPRRRPRRRRRTSSNPAPTATNSASGTSAHRELQTSECRYSSCA